MLNPRQTLLAAGALVYLLGLVLLTHIPLDSSAAPGLEEDHWSEDKVVHLSAYACIAALVTAIPMVKLREDDRTANDCDITLIGVIAAGLTLIAALDEFSQPWFGRSMTPGDWVADIVGVAVGQAFAMTVCMTMPRSTDYVTIGESASVVTSFIGEDEQTDSAYAAAQSGDSWLHLAAVAYSAELRETDRLDENAGYSEWIYEDEQDAEIRAEMADGKSAIGHRGNDRSAVDADRVDSSSTPEGESPAVGRGTPGTGGQLLPSGRRSESVSDSGWVERDLLVWDDARR